jgi:type I restriction enzyme S subunit
MENKEGYKKTKIGWIPADWDLRLLKDVAEINKSSLSNNTAKDFELLYIDIASIIRPGHISPPSKYLYADAPVRARRVVEYGDVIISTVRPYLKAFATIPWKQKNLVCSTGFAVISSNGKCSNEYIFQYSLSDYFQNQVSQMLVGSNYPAINSTDVKNILSPAPPLPEQKKIADILTTVDDKISSIDSQIQQTEQLKKGLMEKLLTEGIGHTEYKETEIGRIPVGWDVVKLKKMALDEKNSFVNGPFGSNLLSTELTTSGVPVIYIRDIVSTKYKWRSNVFITPEKSNELFYCNVQKNDVLITKVGMPPGQATVYPKTERAIITQDVIRIRPSQNVISIFLALLLNSDYAKKEINKIEITGTRTRFSLTEYKKIKLPCPSFQEQKQIATILSTVDDKLDILTQKKSHYQTLKKGLSQQLLTGQMRVKV